MPRSSGPQASSGASWGCAPGSMEDVRAGVVDYRLAYDLGGHLWFAYWPEVVEFDLRFMRGDFAGASQVAAWLRDWIVERHGVRRGGPLRGAHVPDPPRDRPARRGSERGHRPGAGLGLLGTGPAGPLHRAAAWRDRRAGCSTRWPMRTRCARNRARSTCRLSWPTSWRQRLFLDDPVTLRRLRPLVAEHRGPQPRVRPVRRTQRGRGPLPRDDRCHPRRRRSDPRPSTPPPNWPGVAASRSTSR